MTPALAVWEKLEETHKNLSVIFFGRKHTFSGSKNLSWEYKVINGKKNTVFIDVVSGKLNRFSSVYNFFSPVFVLIGFFQALYFLQKFRPDLILSFGSYVSVPVVLAGWFLGIPVVSHEQSFLPGLATRINFPFSRVVCVSWQETQRYFKNNKKTVLTGNPVRNSLITAIPCQIDQFARLKKPVLFVTGGSQGSMFINRLVFANLKVLLENYSLVHQIGTEQNEKEITESLDALPSELKDRYLFRRNLTDEEMICLYRLSAVVISRSGINTVCELLFFQKKAILIPLPVSAGSEQLVNARFFLSHGIGRVVNQTDCHIEKLLSEIQILTEIKGENNFDLSQIKNASDKIALQVEEIYGRKNCKN